MDAWNCIQMVCSSPIWHVGHLFDVRDRGNTPLFLPTISDLNILIVLGDISHTDMQGIVQGVAKAPVIWDVF